MSDYNDFDLLRRMESQIHRIADETLRHFMTDVPTPNRFWQPRVDVYETVDSIVVKAELAGMKPNEINVTLEAEDRVLKISGERTEEDEERLNRIRCYQLEVYFGPFERQIILPGDARIDRDAITATYRDGFLIVTLPKRASSGPESRAIPITNGATE
jgi:HSP20 family protein